MSNKNYMEQLVAIKRAQIGVEFDPSSLQQEFARYYFSKERIKIKFWTKIPGSEECQFEFMTGTVGITTGWKPSFILLRTSRSISSNIILSDDAQIIAVQQKGYKKYSNPYPLLTLIRSVLQYRSNREVTMSNLFIETVSVNQDIGYRINDPEFNETKFDHMGQLYKGLIKEYGRCTSKQYIDVNGKPVQIGWVFQKREKYTDCKQTFLMQTWVSIHTEPPTTTITPHFAKF